MTEQEIKSSRLYIFDPEILEAIQGIDHVVLNYEIDRQNLYVITVGRCTGKKISKCWLRIYKDKNTFIRTPAFLSKFIGKTVRFCVEKIFPTQDEIFRIVPVNFEFIKLDPVRYNDLPHITGSCAFIFPKKYIEEHLDNKVLVSKLAFDRVHYEYFKKGILNCYITPFNSYRSISIRKSKFGVCTGRANMIVHLAESAGKKLSNFIYKTTIQDNLCPYGMIIFKEKINDDIS
jgi:hypothetical protein